MTRSIMLQGKAYAYTIQYKSMHSISIRVSSGQLVVSASRMTPISMIEKLIREHEDKLLAAMNAYEPYMVLEENGYIDLYGQRYALAFRNIGRKQCALHETTLFVYGANRENAIEAYMKETLHDYIEEKVISYLVHDFDLPMPRIDVRHYKGRWGSCFYKNNRISFNISLIHLEKRLIDYVILHELCHFLEANHSHDFYHEMEVRMPDYKQRRKELKEKHV